MFFYFVLCLLVSEIILLYGIEILWKGDVGREGENGIEVTWQYIKFVYGYTWDFIWGFIGGYISDLEGFFQ